MPNRNNSQSQRAQPIPTNSNLFHQIPKIHDPITCSVRALLLRPLTKEFRRQYHPYCEHTSNFKKTPSEQPNPSCPSPSTTLPLRGLFPQDHPYPAHSGGLDTLPLRGLFPQDHPWDWLPFPCPHCSQLQSNPAPSQLLSSSKSNPAQNMVQAISTPAQPSTLTVGTLFTHVGTG